MCKQVFRSRKVDRGRLSLPLPVSGRVVHVMARCRGWSGWSQVGSRFSFFSGL